MQTEDWTWPGLSVGEAKEQKKKEGLPRDRECPEMLGSQQG